MDDYYYKLDDSQLFDLFQASDRIAFTVIYNRYKGLLYFHAFKKLQNKNDVEDVLHDVFSKLWEQRTKLRITNNLGSFLYTVVRNKVLDHLERKKLEGTYLNSIIDFSQTYAENTDHLVRKNQLEAVIDYEISQLPRKMREVLELMRTQGLSNPEIAEKLDIDEKTVRNQLYNARQILRKKIGPAVIILLAEYLGRHI